MDAVGAAGAFPQFLGDMRRDGGQHQQEFLDAFPPGGRVNAALGPDFAQVINQFHQGGDGGVELELVQVVMALADGLMQDPQGIPHRRRVGGGILQGLRVALDQSPDPVKPAGHAVNAHIAPGAALVPGANEHQETAHRVGAHHPHHIIRVDHIAPALAHLFVVSPQDDALVKEAQKGLVKIHQPQIPHNLDEKAGIEQVQNGVFRAAGVLIHRQPLLEQLRVKGAVGVAGADVTEQIPGGIDKGIHRVRFPPGRAAAAGASHIAESGVFGQGRLAGRLELGILGQQYRQILFGNRHNAAGGAVDYGDGRSPVALAGNQPIAQAVGSGTAAPAVLFNVIGKGGHPLGIGHPVIGAGVGHKAGPQIGRRRFAAVPFNGGDDGADGQAVLASKGKVPVIVGRHAHNRAGAVGGQHIVGGENGNALAVQAVDGVGTQGNAGLFLVGGQALDFRSAAGLADIFLDRRPLFRRGQGRH